MQTAKVKAKDTVSEAVLLFFFFASLHSLMLFWLHRF
jgi:diacylglycerol kinase